MGRRQPAAAGARLAIDVEELEMEELRIDS
jgi:hypothetical protein